MKRIFGTLLLIVLIGCGTVAYAEDLDVDCDCKKGGLGLPIGKFIIGIGFSQFNAKPGCDQSIGVGIGIGKETHRIQLGAGYNQGVFGLGIGFKGPEKVTVIGPVIGYDYGDCRLVWPYEE